LPSVAWAATDRRSAFKDPDGRQAALEGEGEHMTNREKRFGWAAAVVFAFLSLALRCAYAAEPSDPLTIHLVAGNPTVEVIGMMTSKKNILPNYGKAYTIEARRVDPCSEAATLLASGAADIAVSCTGALINTNLKLHAGLRVVADVAQNGVDGQNAIWYCVRADSPIKTIQDLKGKTIGTSAYGTWVDLSMRVGMAKAAFDPKEATVVQLPFSAMESSLREKKIDMMSVTPPFYQIAMAKGGVRVLFTAAQAQGRVQGLSLMARQSFLTENPRRVQAFFDDYYRFLRYALDPKNRDEMIGISTKLLNSPPDVEKTLWNTKDDFYRDPNGLPNIDAMKREMATLKEYNLIPSEVDLDKWVDLSFIRKAAADYKR
jgi:ABC-type nitrate/sulfonate/bicarbonate transport system substrate-binding protein